MPHPIGSMVKTNSQFLFYVMATDPTFSMSLLKHTHQFIGHRDSFPNESLCGVLMFSSHREGGV